RDHGKVVRDSARRPHATFHAVGDVVEVHVARGQVRGCICNGDLWLRRVESIVGQAATHPGAVNVRVSVLPGVPGCTSEIAHSGSTSIYQNSMLLFGIC